MKKDITHLFCFVADFVNGFEEATRAQALPGTKLRKPTRVPGLADAEIATIVIMFHQSPCKNFKFFYKSYLQAYNHNEFRELPTYERFVILMKRVFAIGLALLTQLFVPGDNISYVDATALAVCHNKRIFKHKVFRGLAARGKTTMGWFFGFKLHLVINDRGDLVNACVTRGNVDDRTPVPQLVKKCSGILCGDKGYISQPLFERLYAQGLKFITGIKKTMKNRLMTVKEKIILKKRSIIETVNGILKKDMQIQHTRHRSTINAFIHIITVLIAYQLRAVKPFARLTFMLPA